MRIDFYSTGCPKCSVLKKKLDEVGFIYTVHSDTNEMIKMGFQFAPMLIVDGDIMDFSSAIKWIGEMRYECEH